MFKQVLFVTAIASLTLSGRLKPIVMMSSGTGVARRVFCDSASNRCRLDRRKTCWMKLRPGSLRISICLPSRIVRTSNSSSTDETCNDARRGQCALAGSHA